MPVWLDRIVKEANHALISPTNNNTLSFVVDYLLGRGVSTADITEYQIGFTPHEFRVKEASKEFIEWAGPVLLNKLVFPTYSITGETIGIQLRPLEKPEFGPRFNDFSCYPQDVYPYLFGLPQALPHIFLMNQVVLVEGVMDYFALKNHFPNTLAVMTAGTPASVKRFLRRFVKRVAVVYDMDTAGREGAFRLVQESLNDFQVYVPSYALKDPGEMLEKGRIGELVQMLNICAMPL